MSARPVRDRGASREPGTGPQAARDLPQRPLGRLVELEVLSLAVQGKLSLWRSLRAVADEDPTLAAVDFDRLIERAQRQLRTLGRQRLQAAREALAGQRG